MADGVRRGSVDVEGCAVRSDHGHRSQKLACCRDQSDRIRSIRFRERLIC
jgi:hypothetical protein